MAIAREIDPSVEITHPNRDTASAKSTRAVVILLCLASTVLIAIITFGSAGAQAGALPLQVLLAILFAYYAYAVSHWRSGVLPIAAGTAIIAGIFAAVTVSGWFNRGGTGYQEPSLPESVIGVLVFAFAVLQFVTAVVCLTAFSQQWQVEVEVPRGTAGHQPVAA